MAISKEYPINQLLNVFMTEIKKIKKHTNKHSQQHSFTALVLRKLFMPVCILPGVYLLVHLETSKPTNHPSSPSFVAMETRAARECRKGFLFPFLGSPPDICIGSQILQVHFKLSQ